MGTPFFAIRAVYECGWNLFHRTGFSSDARDISVNYSYLDHLSQSGINWLSVFWTNSVGFDKYWQDASRYAHSLGIKLARGVYAYSGGGPEHTMAEPDAPSHLLRPSLKGSGTALCPFEPEARAWFAQLIPRRMEPGMDGILFEPARAISRNCSCERCRSLHPYEWDVMVLNDLSSEVRKYKLNAEIIPYVYMNLGREEKRKMAEAYKSLNPDIRYIASWGSENEAELTDWLEADSRFIHFAKLGRLLLFPGGGTPQETAQKRIASIFKWCRLAAERGKQGYIFDYRIFGGREWNGYSDGIPLTRLSKKKPASLSVIGAAMQNPFMPEQEQKEMLAALREQSDWDLDDPKYFYLG